MGEVTWKYGCFLERPIVPYFILLCLMPDHFTNQGDSTGVQWVNLLVIQTQTHCMFQIWSYFSYCFSMPGMKWKRSSLEINVMLVKIKDKFHTERERRFVVMIWTSGSIFPYLYCLFRTFCSFLVVTEIWYTIFWNKCILKCEHRKSKSTDQCRYGHHKNCC